MVLMVFNRPRRKILLASSYHRTLTSTTGPVRAEGKLVSIGKRVAANTRSDPAAGRD